jgi:hypothetical protein
MPYVPLPCLTVLLGAPAAKDTSLTTSTAHANFVQMVFIVPDKKNQNYVIGTSTVRKEKNTLVMTALIKER